jgi:two-component system sensor histidine kinase TtrS
VTIRTVGHTFLALIILLLHASAVCAAEAVRVGVFSYQGAERAESDWASTFKHLRKTLPQYSFYAMPGDLKTLTDDVAANRLDFIITNPGHYVELEAEYGAARIATVEIQGGPVPSEAVGAVIFTRAARTDIASLHDLRGKRLAAVAAETFGFRQAWREMLKEGVDPFSNLAELSFTGFPVKRVVDAVRDGTSDAGVVRTCVLEEMVAKGLARADEFHVVAAHTIPGLGCQTSTRLYPDWPFVKLSHTSATLAKQVARALLSMPVEANRQDWTVPVDYHSVLDLYYDLQIGPYEILRQHSLANILWSYRYWLTLLALSLIWWIIHVLRVEHLIRKRTRELHEANQKARLRREELEHASRLSLVGEMAGSLAHEISQPLAAIANYARGCERRMQQGGDQAEILHGVRQIAAQAERGGEVVRNMRSFVRKRQPFLCRLDPDLLISDTLALFAPLAERRNVLIELEPHDSLPAVAADKLQLEEVLLNLLQNAADAIEGKPEGKISIRASSAGGVVEIGIADTGPGLDDEAMRRLFETFFTTKPQGLGLGLSLSRSIIESHGGRLWAENIPGGGALFRFTLPVAKG